MRSLCSRLERSRRRRATLARTIMSTFNGSVCSLSHSRTHSYTCTPTHRNVFLLRDLELFLCWSIRRIYLIINGSVKHSHGFVGRDMWHFSKVIFYTVESTRMSVYKRTGLKYIVLPLKCYIFNRGQEVHQITLQNQILGTIKPCDLQTHITSQNGKHVYLESSRMYYWIFGKKQQRFCTII